MQQFLGDPITKAGLERGLEIQHLESVARNQKFDLSDIAVMDFDEAGDPILGKVPKMRTINVIKKGLDDIIEQYRDPATGKLCSTSAGRAINQAGMLGHLK